MKSYSIVSALVVATLSTTAYARLGTKPLGVYADVYVRCETGSLCAGTCENADSCFGTYCFAGNGECTVTKTTGCNGNCYSATLGDDTNHPANRRLDAPSGDEMKAAIDAAKAGVDYLTKLTQDVKDAAAAVQEDIKNWSKQIEGISQDKLQQYVSDVAQASTLLSNAETDATNTLTSVATLNGIVIKQFQAAAGDTDKMKSAIKNGQTVFGAALKNAAEKIDGLKTQVQNAQLKFASARDMSNLFSQTIADNLNNKDGWLDKKKEEIRASAYGGCVASILCGPPCVAICYSTAVPIVETNIATMQSDLNSEKKRLSGLKSQFDDLSTKTGGLATEAGDQYKVLSTAQSNLETAKIIVVSDDEIDYWTAVVIPQLGELKAQLIKALKTNA